MGSAEFSFAPGLNLAIGGPEHVLGHFRAEYGSASSPGGGPKLVVTFVSSSRRPGRGTSVEDYQRGGYKTVRWAISLSDPDASPLEARIRLTGVPRSFGLSLLQGYVVEPLLSIVARSLDQVLLPAAAVAQEGRALLLIGRSRSGKSSLCARVAATGATVLGDDHVLVDSRGQCSPFPRRLRLYPDIAEVAPQAFARLRGRERLMLMTLGVARRLSYRYVAPPLRVQLDALGGKNGGGAIPLGRVVVIERADVPDVEEVSLDPALLVRLASTVVRDQRTVLGQIGGPGWAGVLGTAQDELILGRALAQPSEKVRLTLPASWSAPRSVDAIASALALV
jgi:hypothetical protein